nr:ADP-ribosylation factor-like protein [Candidatus Sigynarchaeota archaeon]
MASIPDRKEGKYKDAKVVIYAGLDNAGKTSINLVVKENIVNIGFIKPTQLVNRSTFQYLDFEIVEYDMGGQKNYIISYFKEPGKYFSEVDALIFVIDVQDGDRIEEAVLYFKDILTQFDAFNIKPKIYVFFHKAERIMFNSYEVDKANMEEAKQLLLNVNKERFPIDFQLTSIMDVWSITRTFAMIMNDLYPLDELIKDRLNNMAITLDASVIVLIDDHMLPIMDNIRNKQSAELIKASAPNIYMLKQSLDRLGKNQSKMLTVLWEGLEFILMALPDAPIKLFLLLIGKRGSFKVYQVEQEVVALAPQIYKLLKLT